MTLKLGNCEDMFRRIINKGMVVKSQQRDEKDYTQDEQLSMLRSMYDENKESFLFKFSKCLSLSDLKNFDDIDNESDCWYFLNKLKEELDPLKCGTKVKNRRYNYLKLKLRNTSYFSDEEMKNRSPFLFSQYIDQYKTEEERLKEKENDLAQNSLSQFLFGTIDNRIYKARCKLEEEAQEEEEDDDDSNDNNDKDFEKCKYYNQRSVCCKTIYRQDHFLLYIYKYYLFLALFSC